MKNRMTIPQANTILLILILGLVNLSLPGCSGAHSRPASVPTAANPPLQQKVQPTQAKIGFTPTPTATAAPAATATATNAPTATLAPLTVVKEENDWVTYRNEVVGYEISAPKRFVIKGGGMPSIGSHLLGPAVPDEEINQLISKYYGDSLNVWIRETDAAGELEPWLIGIYAYDIIVNDLGGVVSPGGMGDYQLTSRQEILQIDGQAYPVKFTVEQRDQQPVGELAVIYLKKDGVELMFGYIQPKDDPEAYQAYLKEVWPEIRKIIETYKKFSSN